MHFVTDLELIHGENAEWIFVRTADAVRACVLAMKEEDIRAAAKVIERSASNEDVSLNDGASV